MTIYTPEDLVDHDAIGAVIFNQKGELLVLKHNKFDFWTIPIGKVQSDATLKETVIKEVKEEVNLDVIECKKLVELPQTYYRRGKWVQVVLHVFEVTRYSGKLKNMEPDKHEHMTWSSIDIIRGMEKSSLSDATRLYIQFKDNMEGVFS